MAESAIRLVPEPLTQAGFAPFGEVIVHDKAERQQMVPGVFDAEGGATTPALTLMWLDQAQAFPITVSKLERHPHSAQSFLPLVNADCLLVACHASRDGSPDLETLKAFLATGQQGVLYRRNVWHKGVTPLADGAQLAMLMMKAQDAPDTLFAELTVSVEVSARS
jgi:ureidoglycolate lyase